jgi:hypothetical protein
MSSTLFGKEITQPPLIPSKVSLKAIGFDIRIDCISCPRFTSHHSRNQTMSAQDLYLYLHHPSITSPLDDRARLIGDITSDSFSSLVEGYTPKLLSGVYLPAPFRVAVSTVLDIYRWLEAPYRS